MLIKKSKIPFKSLATIGILPSFVKIACYRLIGYHIGKNVHIGFLSVIIGEKVVIRNDVKIGLASVIRADYIFIDRYATIGSFTFIDSGKLRIGEDSRINEQVIIGGIKTPDSSLDLGKRTIIMEYSYINTTMPVKIGDDTGIGGHCLLFTHGSWLNQLEGFPVKFAPIELGNNVWLPWRVFVMPGVTVGDRVVVGANSLISKSVKSDCLIAGSPAKVIKENYPAPLTELEIKNQFESIIHEFIRFLKYNKINLESEICSSKIRITTIDEHCEAYFFFDSSHKFTDIDIDTLYAINISSNYIQIPNQAENNKMYIDIKNKKRLGKSKIGEEFVKFVSRYGLRFSRMD